jgi:hypothetical protein
LEAEQRLAAFIQTRRGQYKRLVARVLDGRATVREFRDVFGATTVAREWTEKDGCAGDEAEVNRWATAIKKTKAYKALIQPLIKTTPEAPAGWQSETADDPAWNDAIREVKRRAGGES